MTSNLWLNLSDGHIGSGRRQWDGSGGADGAFNHYQELLEEGKNYPLVVKLGTIAPDGKGEVFSYAQDEQYKSVFDPYLIIHLKNLGLDITKQNKTEMSTKELAYP